MLIHPVSATLSFGQKNTEQSTCMGPFALGGLVVGGACAKFSQLKPNQENIDSFMKTIDEKLPMSGENRSSFVMLKESIEKINQATDKKLESLGISREQKEVSVSDLLGKFVQNDSKTLDGLNQDIKFVQGEVDYFKGAGKAVEFAEKSALLEEKTAIKGIVESAVNGKVATSKLLDYYNGSLKNNPKIKCGLEEMNTLVKKYNKQRYILFPIIGLIFGAVLGSFITSKSA